MNFKISTAWQLVSSLVHLWNPYLSPPKSPIDEICLNLRILYAWHYYSSVIIQQRSVDPEMQGAGVSATKSDNLHSENERQSA